MKRLLVRRGAVGLTLGALAATGLASVAAPAHAVITDTSIGGTAEAHDDGSCTEDPATNTDSPADLQFSDNGVPVTYSYAEARTLTGSNPADVVDAFASTVTTASASPIGTGPATIKITSETIARAIPRNAALASECDGHAYAEAGVGGKFTLTQPMWATISATSKGGGQGGLDINTADGLVALDLSTRTSGSIATLLPAGPVELLFEAETKETSSPNAAERAYTYSASVGIELQPLGAASAVSGKGAGYAQFGARDCATGNVAAAITKKAKKKAKQVVITVNGAKVAKFKGKKLKKRALVLPAAPASAAEVVATIKLKNGKKVTVTRSYLACS